MAGMPDEVTGLTVVVSQCEDVKLFSCGLVRPKFPSKYSNRNQIISASVSYHASYLEAYLSYSSSGLHPPGLKTRT